MDRPHLVRLVRLCRLISDGGMTVQQLRLKLKASRRTIFRDLRMLEQMGVRVQLARHQYRLKHRLADCRKKIVDAQIRDLNRLLDAAFR